MIPVRQVFAQPTEELVPVARLVALDAREEVRVLQTDAVPGGRAVAGGVVRAREPGNTYPSPCWGRCPYPRAATRASPSARCAGVAGPSVRPLNPRTTPSPP